MFAYTKRKRFWNEIHYIFRRALYSNVKGYGYYLKNIKAHCMFYIQPVLIVSVC